MKKNTIVFIFFLSVIAAVALSMWQNRKDGLDGRLFGMLQNTKQHDVETIKTAVRYYNQYGSMFYNTGGEVSGLDEIPAAPLLKRRLFKDITMLKRDGLVMVFDRDVEEIKKIYFLSRGEAVAETNETWFVALQDYRTRKPVSSIKAVPLQARYHLKKEPRGWIVYETDVYPASENIPLLNRRQAL